MNSNEISVSIDESEGDSMDMIKEVLEFDPLAQAEMAFGNKHWSEFSEDEMMVSGRDDLC